MKIVNCLTSISPKLGQFLFALCNQLGNWAPPPSITICSSKPLVVRGRPCKPVAGLARGVGRGVGAGGGGAGLAGAGAGWRPLALRWTAGACGSLQHDLNISKS